MSQLKTCVTCKVEKTLEEFNKDKGRRDGLNVSCKICVRTYHRAWTKENIEKVLESARARYHANPKGKKKASCAAWELANKEKRNADSLARAHANPEKTRAKNRAWYAKHPGKAAEKCRRREAVRKGQLCACCKPKDISPLYKLAKMEGLQVDHIQPLTKGGLHCRKNMQLLTPEENLRKGNKWDGSTISHRFFITTDEWRMAA